MTFSTGVIQTPQMLKTPALQEFIAVTAPNDTGAKRTPRIVRSTSINGSTSSASFSITSSVYGCPSPNPPSFCIWNVIIVDIGQTTTSNFKELVNCTLLLTKKFPMILMCRPPVVKYSAMNSLLVPGGMSTCAE